MSDSDQNHFNEPHVLHALKHYLPGQTALKDFIHHNSLHAFQEQDFYSAIFTASEIFSYRVMLPLEDFRTLFQIGRINSEILKSKIKERKGVDSSDWLEKCLTKEYKIKPNPRIGRLRSHWKSIYHLDIDNLIQPLLFRVLSSYLDQGIAIWHFPYEDRGLLNALREIEKHSFFSFFKTPAVKALLMNDSLTMHSLLVKIVGKEEYFEQYIFDQQFAHRGWSGMAATVEDRPDTLLYTKKIELKELIILELLLELDVLYHELGDHWSPLAEKVTTPPVNLFENVPTDEFKEVMKIWQDAFEWSYYDEVLRGLRAKQKQDALMHASNGNEAVSKKSFQAIFCIDEREDSLRRHIEFVDQKSETLGCPGFFGVEFYFQPEKGKFYEKLCPAPVTPKYLIKEHDVQTDREHEILYHENTHTFIRGFITTLSLGFWAAVRLVSNLFNPRMSPAISNAFAHMNIHGKLTIENKSPADTENGLQIGFTIEEMATRVEGLLRGIGLIKNFSSLVYVVAHGSSSANNPHHGAHDCGACSGRPGSVNARVFAFMANHPKVRAILATKGLLIPDTTQFVGALHDTAADEMAFYDEHIISKENLIHHEQNKISFENALDLNAKERSRRFASIDITRDIKHVRKAIKQRSVSLFEPRPELGHGTNALCFVGKRSLTKGLFLDRRAFMNSYDYTTDPDGTILLGVMRPLPPVCGGINLEYYFSRVDNQKLGAGTKLPHNVVGLIGVANSSDGDLRPGLPLQMIEVHDPVRLLILVEHFPEVVLNTIKSDPGLYPWFEKGWVHLMAIDPLKNTFHYFRNGDFELYTPLDEQVREVDDFHHFFENATEMETNHIVHATQENLPVTIINPVKS